MGVKNARLRVRNEIWAETYPKAGCGYLDKRKSTENGGGGASALSMRKSGSGWDKDRENRSQVKPSLWAMRKPVASVLSAVGSMAGMGRDDKLYLSFTPHTEHHLPVAHRGVKTTIRGTVVA